MLKFFCLFAHLGIGTDLYRGELGGVGHPSIKAYFQV